MSRSVVVTGATSGIGLATCLELAATGYDVIGTARSEAKAALLHEIAAKDGCTVRTVLLDVDDEACCRQAMAEVAALTGGGPWALVNNAGYLLSGAVEDLPDEQVRAQLETNVVAPVRLARLVLPGMRARGEGRIVMISSVAGRLSTPLMGWYGASKHALEAVTDALRMEVVADGVRVVLVEPGVVDTDIWSAASDGGFPPSTHARYAFAYVRAAARSRHSGRATHPVSVARTVRVALDSPAPRARYLVGVDVIGGVLAEAVVPTTLADYVKGLATGLRPLPFRR